MNKLIVATLSWQGFYLLDRLKFGLENNLKNLDIDYIWKIRSNGCKDQTQEAVSKWKNVELMSIDHNRDSFSKGVNSLLSNIDDSDIVMLLNNDVEFISSDVIANMTALLKDKIGIVGQRLMYPRVSSNEPYKIQHKGVGFSYRYGGLGWHLGTGDSFKESDKLNRYYQAVTAACCVIQGAVWNHIGGLDEGYHYSMEDVDFNLQTQKLGYKIICSGAGEVLHGESVSLKKNPINKLFMNQNIKHFKSKWWKDGKPIYDIDYEKYNDPNFNVVK